MNVDVNYVAVVVAAIASMIVGFLYYSPFILGKPWMKEHGYTPDKLKEMQAGNAKWYAGTFVLALITAYVLYHIYTLSLNFFHNTKMVTATSTAFWVWLGFIMTTQLTATIFSEKKNFKLFAIDTGFQLVAIMAMGIVIGYLG